MCLADVSILKTSGYVCFREDLKIMIDDATLLLMQCNAIRGIRINYVRRIWGVNSTNDKACSSTREAEKTRANRFAVASKFMLCDRVCSWFSQSHLRRLVERWLTLIYSKREMFYMRYNERFKIFTRILNGIMSF